MKGRELSIPTPRCPFCNAILEEAQLKWEAKPQAPNEFCWHEVWTCLGCKTTHVFPARKVFLEYVKDSQLLPRSDKVLLLPF